MFREILNKYLKTRDISQSELTYLTGDSQQAISDFLNKTSNPQRKTKDKFFTSIPGFKEFYDNSVNNLNKAEEPLQKYYSPNLEEFSVDEIMGYVFKNKDKKEFKNNITYKMFTELIIKEAIIEKNIK